MVKIKIGDIVHLNSEPTVLFTVIVDLYKMFPNEPHLENRFYMIGVNEGNVLGFSAHYKALTFVR